MRFLASLAAASLEASDVLIRELCCDRDALYGRQINNMITIISRVQEDNIRVQ